jgi:hypothetical protein
METFLIMIQGKERVPRDAEATDVVWKQAPTENYYALHLLYRC